MMHKSKPRKELQYKSKASYHWIPTLSEAYKAYYDNILKPVPIHDMKNAAAEDPHAIQKQNYGYDHLRA